MRTIWLEAPHVRLKAYSASVKGTKSSVRVDIECQSPDSLGYLLRQLEEIDRGQKAEAKADATLAKAKGKSKVLALPPPSLQLPYLGDET